MPTYAETLAQFAHDLHFWDIPPAVVEDMKLRVLDILGICLATSRMDYAAIVAQTAREMSARGPCTAVRHGRGWSPPAAAFLNGTLAHGVDFDDTHVESITHPSGVVVPAGLAAGEKHGASGETALAAMVAGSEALIRMGLVAPLRFHEKGFQATGVCGPYAAALVAGRIAGLDARRLGDALGQCGSFGAGLRAFSDDGTWSKRLFSGWAAHGGIVAAELAGRGYLGPHAIFESRWGLYSAHVGLDKCDLSQLTRGLGTDWETPRTSFKPYPASHGQHSFIDCALRIRREHRIKPEDIEEIEVILSLEAARWWMNPREVKVAPPTPYAARFSLPFSVCGALVMGKMGLGQYTEETIRDPRILALTPKVRATDDPESEFPRRLPGWVRVRTGRGRTYEHRQRIQRGCPDNPMTREELEGKFFANARLSVGRKKAVQIRDTVARLESLAEVSELTALVR